GRVRDEREFREVVGRRVRLQRQWLRMGQQQVADAARVSRNFVSAIERGSQGLDAWRLGLVADALGVSVDWVLDRIPGPITVPGPRPRPRL
ncbi:MAG TPA: helix-turn-helix transcriptional regulator, partial [Mycobacteriales bacterium]|nr:helix-turn-helix transcriptional regulator [Mycobacteriales bacterium]